MSLLLVSIHDVTPRWSAPVRSLWALCRERGVTPALLVVPDWHGEWPLESQPRFAAWLRARSADGATVFLHGERHDEAGLPRTWRDHCRAFGRTAREAEFLTLRFDAACERIERGVRRLRRLGLDPIGFVPPAWLAREDAFEAARAVGLCLAEDRSDVRLLTAGRRLRAPVYCWSARRPWRAWASLLVAEARQRVAATSPLVRIALHPLDLSHPATAFSLTRTLRRLASLHATGCYVSLLRTEIDRARAGG